MKDGFVKVAAATPAIRVADCEHNTTRILALMEEAAREGVRLLVLPELCVTGYTCGDLFFQQALVESAASCAARIAASAPKNMVVVFGCPLELRGKLYNCAFVATGGKLLGLVPKVNIPNYQEFGEGRWFAPAPRSPQNLVFGGQETVMFGDIVFCCRQMPSFRLSAEICEDLWVPDPPSVSRALAGATVVANLSASDEFAGKEELRRGLVRGQSSRLVCAYVYSGAGEGESSTDLVFVGHNMVCEDGEILASCQESEGRLLVSEVDVKKLDHERKVLTTFAASSGREALEVPFDMDIEPAALTRKFARLPFVPDSKARCREIVHLQALALKRRMAHIGSKTAVIGLSGGLDSTLALIVVDEALRMLGKGPEDLVAVTMPGFGTGRRTLENARKLAASYGCQLREIDIRPAVLRHFADIGHDPKVENVVFENAQARERTQILMDIANETGGLVIGTGDLSELALGWTTYNGDHMSGYSVNCGVPKTLVRALVVWAAEASEPERRAVLMDIAGTPISPELLSPQSSGAPQSTEAAVGPYELQDFFLYNVLRWGHSPSKVLRLACHAFDGVWGPDAIEKWLRIFYRRFFSQQFKRSCLPDGPKVGPVSLSPRGDLRMPSDATMAIWMDDLEEVSP